MAAAAAAAKGVEKKKRRARKTATRKKKEDLLSFFSSSLSFLAPSNRSILMRDASSISQTRAFSWGKAFRVKEHSSKREVLCERKKTWSDVVKAKKAAAARREHWPPPFFPPARNEKSKKTRSSHAQGRLSSHQQTTCNTRVDAVRRRDRVFVGFRGEEAREKTAEAKSRKRKASFRFFAAGGGDGLGRRRRRRRRRRRQQQGGRKKSPCSQITHPAGLLSSLTRFIAPFSSRYTGGNQVTEREKVEEADPFFPPSESKERKKKRRIWSSC